jgi:hypothetical protein
MASGMQTTSMNGTMKTTIHDKCLMSQRNGTHAKIYALMRDPELKNKDRIRDGDKDKKSFGFVKGSTYNGQWKDDRRHGFGTLVYPDGTKYEGDWSYDQRHGNGTLWIKEGKKSVKEYVGAWYDGSMEGFGTFHYPNGEVYKGDWVANKRHGKGRLEYPNGDYFVGDWENDCQRGVGILYFKNGNIFEGMWLDGKKDGMGKFFYASTLKVLLANTNLTVCYESVVQVYEGEWVNDQPRCGEYRDPNSNESHRFGESSVRKENFTLPEIGLKQPRTVIDVATSQVRLDRALRLGQFCEEVTQDSLLDAEAEFVRLDTHGSGLLSLWVLGSVFSILGLSLSTSNLHDIAHQLELGNFATLSFPEVVDIATCLISGDGLSPRATFPQDEKY